MLGFPRCRPSQNTTGSKICRFCPSIFNCQRPQDPTRTASPNRGREACGHRPRLPNGDDRVRTDGLRSASAALSQLSYIPLPSNMGLGRVELPTSRLSGVRSNHLSYRPDAKRTFSDENASSCLKKEKRRRRNPALSLDPVRFLRPVRCLGRADMASVRAHP